MEQILQSVYKTRVNVIINRSKAYFRSNLNNFRLNQENRLCATARATLISSYLQSSRYSKKAGIALGSIVASLSLGSSINVIAESMVESSIIKEADELYEKTDYEELYNLLIKFKTTGNDEILWRLGRARYQMARAAVKDEDRKILFREALNYVEQALEINANNFAIHKWMSILIDYVSAFEGTKARILQSYVVHDHMQKACELNPTDGTSRHLLGLWYFNVADLPWYLRRIASVVFATPPSGTFEEALDQFLHAEKIEPNFFSKNHLYIGKCYMKLGKKEEAKKYLELAKNCAVNTLDDEEAVKEAEQLLSSL